MYPEDFLLPHGSIQTSIGGTYKFRILGPCCILYDRETLPWPCCRLSWRNKEPSWRRIGRRLIPDFAARHCPSYAVELLHTDCPGARTVLTLFPYRLPPEARRWWYAKILPKDRSE